MEQQTEFIVVFAVIGIIFLFAIYQIQARRGLQKSLQPEQSTWGVFILLVAVAVGIRIAIAYATPGYESDMGCFRSWADIAYSNGYAEFYNGDYFADYPPLYIYVLSFLGWIRDMAGMDLGGAEYGLLIKTPALVTDIFVAVAVYIIAKREFGGKTGLLLSALILLNPAVMMNSAVWGQVDVIFTAVILLVLWLLYKEKLVWAAALFMIAFLLKPQAVLIAPVLLFVFIRNIIASKEKLKAWLALVVSAGVMVLLFFVVQLPFGINQEPLWLVDRMMETMGQYPYASLNSFNLFSMLGLNFVDVSSVSWFSLPLNVWGYIFIAAVCVYVLWLYIKNPKREFLFALASLIILGVFTFGHGMHERYIFPVPFLMLIAYILIRDKRLLFCTVLLFGVLLANQVVSLYYYQVVIPQGLMVACSAVSVGISIYSFYVATKLALEPPIVHQPQAVEKEEKGHLIKPMQIKKEKIISKKDMLLMLIITVVYACVAYINLGSFEIPQTNAVLQNGMRIEFSEVEHVSKIKYYAGYGKGGFALYASEDGQEYHNVGLIAGEETLYEVDHEKGDLYAWEEYDTDISAKYIEFLKVEGDLPIHEFAFYNEQGNLIEQANVTYDGKHIDVYFDEQLIVPQERTYMTDFYFDEIYHVRTAYENIHGITPYEVTHPPLGKILISIGINLFGMNPFGWRFMGTLAGVLMLPIIYILAKMILKKSKYAAFAAVLFAVDFMHFAQTRIATIDSFSVLWILCMFTCMFWYAQTNFNTQKVEKTLLPLFLCGLFFGLGAATKWLCIYAGIGLLVIFLIMMYRRYKEYVYAKQSGEYPPLVEAYKRKLGITLLACVAFFILIPLAIYLHSYTPYMMVTDGGAYTGLGDIVANQDYMLNYHAYLNPDHVHPFSSNWYSWPVNYRPVLFFSNQNQEAGTIATLSTMGNPLIWWTGIVAVASLIYLTVRNKKHRNFGLLFLAVAALCQYMPWWFISREVYIYHYFAIVPFLILLIVYWLKILEEKYRYGKQFGVVFVIVCAVFFVLFYPVITGVPADAGYVTGLRWLGTWPFY
ncbi:phospholipid carrier-dependent glycosyltransferase [Christensenellaceae bacterium OttesenSCG-928-K19]|nr:phospholipid carrier-dependent glycosyltransferase [Christensenellaceae bacterium OttesenSCG-928-K19]